MRWCLSGSTAGYITAVASSAAATALTWWLSPEAVGLSSLFFAAVMFSAWYGGLGPGLVATAISGFATAYLFIEPTRSLTLESDDLVRLGVFVAVSVLISSLHTRTRESEQVAVRARQEAEAASQAKDRFLAVVSHELRNPLNPVLTIASLWESDASLPAEVREDMSVIRRNVELESRLIEDLLDVSRITAGKLALRRQAVEMQHVVRDAVSVCDSEAKQKQLHVEVDSADGPMTVEGDPTRLRQVVWNLLSNAVKFTPAGGRIAVSVTQTTASTAPAVEICVRDNGVGMDETALARIFNAFEQGGHDVTRRYGGLGLGLAIARALTEAHGGTLTAHSDGPGRGAEFTLRLPLSTGRPAHDLPLPAAGITAAMHAPQVTG